jgi:hypothetical protein
MVAQTQRQGAAELFKLYSQAKLGMMREALAKLDRGGNERVLNFRRRRSSDRLFTFFPQLGPAGLVGVYEAQGEIQQVSLLAL